MAKRTCSYPECMRPATRRGWCSLHYQRWRTHGSPDVVLPSGPRPNARAVASNGYIRVKVPGHPEADKYGWAYEHRVVAHDTFGPIPAGHHVHHVNRDKTDNRPANLEVVNHAEHGAEHREIDRTAVVAMYRDGLTTTAIAERLGVTSGAVSRALSATGEPTRSKSDYRVQVDVERLIELHGTPGYRVPQIAAELGVGKAVVRRWMRELGLPPFPVGRPK